MAGIWERMIPGGENSDRIGSHLAKAVVYLVGRGVFSGAQASAALNSHLQSPLTTAESADFSAILSQLNGQPNATAKIDYLERLDALNICAEMGVLTNETVYRTQLGI